MNLEHFDIADFKEYLAMKKIIALNDIDYKPIPQWNPLASCTVQAKAKCTKFCSNALSGTKCSKGKSCTFAHRIEDWSPVTCNFGDNCNRKTSNCGYIHPSEKKEDFAKRVNQKLPLPVSVSDDEEDEEIEVIVDKPCICVPKECEEMVKETMKQRGINNYTIRTF
jgi:hypothetical protein